MKRQTRVAFTLMEILLVIAILSVLAAILFTTLFAARKNSRDTVCLSQLRQLGIAIKMYENDFNDLPRQLKDVYPTYVSEKKTFRCPEWEARAAGSDSKTQATVASLFTLYAYQPAERRFWQSVPSEPGDPPAMKSPWQEGYEIRGERLPLITCQFHDPYLEQGGEFRSGTMTMIRMVLRLDGSVEKSTGRLSLGKNLAWYDF
jgi:prepilin-type N-terminal cleavage/methylation domain-containing protein